MQVRLRRGLVWYRGLIGNTGFVGKLLLLGLPFVCVCAFCSVLVSPFTGRSSAPTGNTLQFSPGGTVEAGKVQATAKAIETENAQIIGTWTATHKESVATDTLPPASETFVPTLDIDATTTRAAETPTIFYVVVTGVPTDTRAPVATRIPTKRPPTKPLPAPATIAPHPTNAPEVIPTVQTTGRFVASSEARTYYYCANDPQWKTLKAALIWSDDEATFTRMGLVLHKSC